MHWTTTRIEFAIPCERNARFPEGPQFWDWEILRVLVVRVGEWPPSSMRGDDEGASLTIDKP
eukprot:scaffold2859_cov349-Pavlova_lutheri.AAC.64